MDLRSLHTFIQVAEVSSFTRAAEKLGYSQPTVSLQIKQLEKELGIRVFDRVGHTVSLTDGGREALEYAQKICRMSQQMLRGAAAPRTPSGIIRLTMADSLFTPLIVRRFARFRASYPQISLKVTTAGTDEMFRLLDHNEADLVCTLDSHIYDASYVIASEEKVGVHFVCAADHPLTKELNVNIRRLMEQPMLLTEKGMSYRRLLDDRLAQDSLEATPILEIGSADAICQLVEEGMGISFLPDYVTQAAVDKGTIIRIPVQGFRVELWRQLLYHRDKWLSPQLQAAIEYLSGILLGAAEG